MVSTSRRKCPRLSGRGSSGCGAASCCAAIAIRRAWAADSSCTAGLVRAARVGPAPTADGPERVDPVGAASGEAVRRLMTPMLPSGTDSARMLACWRLVSSSSVRPATDDDAPAVARLQLTVWQQAFAAVLPAAALGTDPAVHAASWADRIEQGGPVLLAVEG